MSLPQPEVRTQRRVESERHDRNEPWGGPMSSSVDACADGCPNAAPKAQGAGKSPAPLVLVCVAVHSSRLSLRPGAMADDPSLAAKAVDK